jgi:hypothetical protein
MVCTNLTSGQALAAARWAMPLLQPPPGVRGFSRHHDRIETGSAVATGPNLGPDESVVPYGSLHVGTVIHAVGPNYMMMAAAPRHAATGGGPAAPDSGPSLMEQGDKLLLCGALTRTMAYIIYISAYCTTCFC